MKKKDLPKCPDNKRDCFAGWATFTGSCECLLLTEGITNCPFYKTHEEFRKGREHEKGKHGIYN